MTQVAQKAQSKVNNSKHVHFIFSAPVQWLSYVKISHGATVGQQLTGGLLQVE